MTSFSHNDDQKATVKRPTVHRSQLVVARKIIAFEAVLEANQTKSGREITALLNIPNSTMQTWRKEGVAAEESQDEIGLFFSKPAGADLLQSIVCAIMYNNKCGLSGINGAQECLRNAGLSKYVATSIGALQNFWLRYEDAIAAFGKHWVSKLSEGMKQRKITVILDEMFRKQMPCLVAIEAVSNYILLEKFTKDRKAETWKEELKSATREIPVKIGQVVSDLCGAIRSLANELEAEHSPDIFHGQYEISKATSGAFGSQERAAKRDLDEAEERLKKAMDRPDKNGKKEKERQRQKREKAQKKRDEAKEVYEKKKARREQTRAAKKQLGQVYHPINIETGQLQSPELIAKKFDEQFTIIERNVSEAGLGESSRERVKKSKRAFGLMLNYIKRFFVVFAAVILELQLSQEQEVFFKEVTFPLCYFKMIWRRLPKKEKEKLIGVLEELERKQREGPGTAEYKEALMRRGKELAEIFQRSSSCVEGRNGFLSLLLHRFHHINPKTLKVLSIVHNFGVRRKGDGSTAAERFFGGKHDDLFNYVVKNVRIPGKPQLQVRKKSRWAA